ncbi:ABC-2 type transport system permease protein [Trichlorobacter thiogenes]|uniref:ABC-2 type transport system permease protein n=1 Tax=Trichlorobacter thiogenes TaxID=115783 RepID=A0A1T4M6L5_9BACT|nr:ABC transporter permease [Trichlorobacter thiogenes]SJZ62545.1 ABC-2 type transport system permease protein [Trichlorobacter thiogenes]
MPLFLRRITAVGRKEFLHVLRDPRSLALGILMPLIMLFLFGYALTLDVDRVPLAVWDQSNTAQSRELISRFEGSRYFSLRLHAASYQQLEQAVDRRDALIALVIPADFAGRLDAGTQPVLQLILDGSDPNTATIAQGYAEAIVLTWSRQISLAALQRRFPQRATQPIPLEIRPRVWFNSDLVSRNFIFPGLIPVIMMIVAALLTSLSMAREWETGTMEQIVTMPVRKWELIIGKLAPYFCIGVVDLLLSVGVGYYVFSVPLKGSLLLLSGLSLLFLVGALAVGMLISIIAKSQLLASQLALLVTVLPAFLLSGFIFPLENMPAPIQAVSHIVVARYFVTILRGIYLKDVGMETLWPQALFLVGFAALILSVAVLKFKKKLG